MVTPNSACGGLNSNGEVRIDLGAPSGFTINWYEADSTTALGVITTSAVISADTAALSLPSGKYVVEIIDTTGINLNCTSMAAFTVGQDTAILAVNPLTLVDKTNCSPGNGAATVVDVKEDITNFPAGSGNYEFEWLDAASTAIPWPVNLVTLTDLDSGTFYVKARNITTNCESAPRQFNIIQTTADPTIAANLVTPNSACGALNSNGEVAISIANASDYIINWLEADSTTALGVITTSAVISADTAATVLPPGKYVVQIIDTTGVNLNCNTMASFTVGQDTAILAVNPLTLVDKTNCSPGNGSATVVDVKEDITNFPAGSGNYEFEWLDAASTTIPWPVNLVSLTDLDSGAFYVKARNITTNCESSFKAVQHHTDDCRSDNRRQPGNTEFRLRRPQFQWRGSHQHRQCFGLYH